MLAIQRIVAPTDFSRHSELSLEAAVELATRFDAELHVLHIVVPQIYQSEMPEMMMPPVADLTEDMLAAARRRMETWRQGLPADLNLDTHVIESTRKEDIAICAFAEAQAADLIVIGSHGHTGLMHMLLGSTAEHVVRHAHCPVLVVKPRVPIT
jgi:nucleotide-binding universal stress UspA family protein